MRTSPRFPIDPGPGIPHDLVHRPVPLSPMHQPGGEPPRTVTFEPWVFPPVNAQFFDVVNSTSVAGGTTSAIPIASTEAKEGVIRYLGNETPSSADYAFLTWTLLFNGSGVYPWVNMTQSRGLLANPDPVLIFVPRQTVVTVNVSNSAGVAINALTRIKGWLY